MKYGGRPELCVIFTAFAPTSHVQGFQGRLRGVVGHVDIVAVPLALQHIDFQHRLEAIGT